MNQTIGPFVSAVINQHSLFVGQKTKSQVVNVAQREGNNKDKCSKCPKLSHLCFPLFLLVLASRHKLDWPYQYTGHSWAQVSQFKPDFLAHQEKQEVFKEMCPENWTHAYFSCFYFQNIIM